MPIRTATIAVCSWSLRPASPGQLLEALRRVGIQVVQLALGPVVDDPAMWADGVQVLRDAGIDVVSGMMATRGEDYSSLESIALTGGLRPDDRWDENRRHAEAVARVAGHAGIPLVTFHAGFIPEAADAGEPAATRSAMIERLRTVADLFAASGVDVALETGQETAGALQTFLEELDRPRVGVNFDPANMILYGKGDPVQSLRALAQRVRQIHVKDAVPTENTGTWGREVTAGRGAVDWPAFFDVVETLDTHPALIIEREAGRDRTDDIRAARDLIQSHIQ